jgi:hypothetical protein
MFPASILGQGKIPWEFAHWLDEFRDLATQAPDLIIVPLLGMWIWLSDRPVRTAPIVFWVTVFGAGVIALGKLGSAPNYFLSLRVAEALAIGAIWGAASKPGIRSTPQVVAALLVMAAALVPSTFVAVSYAQLAMKDASFYPSPEGRRFLVAQRQILSLAENPRVRIFTDSALLQLHQKERAPYIDGFEFRLMVNHGQIRPSVMLDELQTEAYDQLIMTSDLNQPDYAANTTGLPNELALAARTHYVLAGRRLGLYLYVPRGTRRIGSLDDAAREPSPSRR